MKRLLLVVLIAVLGLPILSGSGSGIDLIVTLKPGESIDQIHRNHKSLTLQHVPDTDIYLVRVDDDGDYNKLLKRLRQNRAVLSVEADSQVRLRSVALRASTGIDLVYSMADLLEDDTLTNFYGTVVLDAYANQPALDRIYVRDVRTLSSGAATRVAYIDTGVDPNHPALRPWLEEGVDLVNDSSASEFDGLVHSMADLLEDGAQLLNSRFFFLLNRSGGSLLGTGSQTPPAAFGHGTMVAGLIHAVAPEARIYPIKAFDPYGYTTMYRIVDGIHRAISADADVLNMSFSTNVTSETLKSALDTARAAGVALVAAAGNDGIDASSVFPAAYSSVIAVAATDLNDKLAAFSNYGKSISVTAPGAFVISTAPGGRYAAAWGTSFSAPLVSGSIALVASISGRGQSDPALLQNAAESIDALNPGFEKQLGKGRINLQQAFARRVKQ